MTRVKLLVVWYEALAGKYLRSLARELGIDYTVSTTFDLAVSGRVLDLEHLHHIMNFSTLPNTAALSLFARASAFPDCFSIRCLSLRRGILGCLGIAFGHDFRINAESWGFIREAFRIKLLAQEFPFNPCIETWELLSYLNVEYKSKDLRVALRVGQALSEVYNTIHEDNFDLNYWISRAFTKKHSARFVHAVYSHPLVIKRKEIRQTFTDLPFEDCSELDLRDIFELNIRMCNHYVSNGRLYYVELFWEEEQNWQYRNIVYFGDYIDPQEEYNEEESDGSDEEHGYVTWNNMFDTYEDQMWQPTDMKKLETINDIVELQSDRTVIKKILAAANLQTDDWLDMGDIQHKKYYDFCENYGVPLQCRVKFTPVQERQQILKQMKTLKITKSSTFKHTDYIKSDWLKISDFLAEIAHMDKGKQHKACRAVVQELNDKWCSTFYHNSNNDCRHLMTKFKNLNIESHIHTLSKFQKKLKYFSHLSEQKTNVKEFLGEYEDQMYSFVNSLKTTYANINSAANNVSQTANNINHTTQFVDTHLPTIMARIDRIAVNCDTITTKFLTLMQSFEIAAEYMNYFMILLKFVSFGYLVAQEKNQTPSNIAALISLILPTGVGNSILLSLTRAVTGIIRHFSAATQEQGEDEDHGYNFGNAIFSTIKTMTSSIFTKIDDKAYSTMKINTFYLKTISDFLRSTTTIVSFLLKAITFTVDFIINKIMEHYGMLPVFLKDGDFEKIIDEYIDIKKNDHLQDCGEDLISARKVIALRTKINDLEAQMNRNILKDKTLVYKISPYIRIMATDLNKAYDDIPPQYKGNDNAHRIKPFFVLICGPPRIGKSKIFQPLLVNALALRMKLIDEYQDPQHYCCFRVAGREFWDGGQGKKSYLVQ